MAFTIVFDMGKIFKERTKDWDNDPPPLFIPNDFNIEVTGKCEFDCPNCYGSKLKDYDQELTAKQWLKIIDKTEADIFLHDNIYRAILTGGEPLMYSDLEKLIIGLRQRDIEIGLSTTGLDRNNKLPKLLNHLDNIGIPIDGDSPEANAIWRKHPTMKDSGLSFAINALMLIQKTKPYLSTTVRTLVHRGNVNEVIKIPVFLEKSGIDISRLNWNLYELNTRQKLIDKYVYIDNILASTNAISSSNIGPEKFDGTIREAGQNFKNITIKALGHIANINFMINPSGTCRTVTLSESSELEEMTIGNLHTDFEETIIDLNRDINVIAQLSEVASQSIEYHYYLQNRE